MSKRSGAAGVACQGGTCQQREVLVRMSARVHGVYLL